MSNVLDISEALFEQHKSTTTTATTTTTAEAGVTQLNVSRYDIDHIMFKGIDILDISKVLYEQPLPKRTTTTTEAGYHLTIFPPKLSTLYMC